MDHLTSRQGPSSCPSTAVSPQRSASSQYRNDTQSIPMVVQGSAGSSVHAAQDVAGGLPSIPAPLPYCGPHSDVIASGGLTPAESSRQGTLHPTSTFVAQGRRELESHSNSSAVNPQPPATAQYSLGRSSTSRRTMKQVDILMIDSTEPPTRSIPINTVFGDASAIDIVGRDKWRQYRGMPPSLKAHCSTPPATSTSRATFGRTQVQSTPSSRTRRQPGPQHADFSRYSDAHHGLTQQDIVERGQKSQCTACGELPLGDGKPNHRWFNCPGLPPRPPRQVPAIAIVPQSARTACPRREGPVPGGSSGVDMPMPSTMLSGKVPAHVSTRCVPQVVPPSARAPRDTVPHLAAVLNVIDAMRKNPITEMNGGGSQRVSLAVPPPGEETKLHIQPKSQDRSMWNTSKGSIPCGSSGQHLVDNPTRHTASAVASLQQNIHGRHVRRMEAISRQAENAAIPRNQVEHETYPFPHRPGSATAQVAKHTKKIGKLHHSTRYCLPLKDVHWSGKAQARPLADGRRPVTFLDFQKHSIQEHTQRKRAMVAHEEQSEPEKARTLGCADTDKEDLLPRRLQPSDVEYTKRSNKTKVQRGQGSEFGRSKVEVSVRVRVSVNASTMGENRGKLRNSRGVVESTDGFPPLVGGRATDGNPKPEAIRGVRQSPVRASKNTSTNVILSGTVAGFFAWFENAHAGPGGTTPTTWRTANMINARNVIHREAFNLQSIKGMSRREWKAIGVNSRIGAEISRSVEEYFTRV